MRRALAVLAAMAAMLLPAAPAAPAAAGRSFTLTAGGDILIHRGLAQIADAHAPGANVYDFTPLLDPIEPWVGEADLAICHLEGALDPANTGLSYYPLFNAPHEVADALAATGYDACSTAGNHTLDHGFTGVSDTLDTLDAAGIGHAGSARTAAERLPSLYEVNGVIVGHLSYTYGTNGIPAPSDKPWAVNLIGDGDAILEDARWARENGAEFIILSIHWGTEYQVQPTAGQVALAERLLSSPDIDLILGTHVHVVQPIGRVNGEVVVYGMGNELSNMLEGCCGHTGTQDGIMVHLTVREIEGRFLVTRTQYTPTWVHPTTKAVTPVAHSLAYGPGTYESGLQASLQRTVSRVSLLGVPAVTLSPTPWPALLCRGAPATLVGTAGDDVISGTTGRDVIVGRGGSDVIYASDGDDLVCADDGDDTVLGGNGHDRVYGGEGADHLQGMAGDDLLEGGVGDDTLDGHDGRDRLWGGEGADGLYGGVGDDILDGGWGDDRLIGYDGADELTGEQGTDYLSGGRGADLLSGGMGADRLYGGDDPDVLLGGADADALEGGSGDDELHGGTGDDDLAGSGGVDFLDGGAGTDACRGGPLLRACEG
ncbi:MAG: capA 1 [Acidobacteria bacterium]|nr:capA 1 [Acidobacteriota bacterium]